MSHASRLSGFFLAAHGVVLAGFSATLYWLAAHHLHRQVDERLDAALAMLVAAAEVNPGAVEWEPKERDLGLGRDRGADQIRWLVRDDRDRLLDQSANLDPRQLSITTRASIDSLFHDRGGFSWQSKTRRLSSPVATGSEDAEKAGNRAAGSNDDQPTVVFPSLTFVAFAPLGPTEATLWRLALTLGLLSTTLLLASAVAGQRLCRRALAPLMQMAVAARDAHAADPGTRLPLTGTNDELDELGLAFNGLLDRLHETLERQRRFTGDASHQLRTPLAGLLSQVDVALRRDRSATEYQRVLGIVRSRSVHLRQIIESLLFLARAETESGRPELEIVDLTVWMTDHIREWSEHARADDIQLVSSEEGPLRVRAHSSLLSQLVDNLLENACKYSPQGTPIVVRIGRESGGIRIDVLDRGSGLSAEQQSCVFQPFYRAPEARSGGQGGIGLGLTVADRIATVFGGTIRVESQPGEGSRFQVTLPEAPRAAPEGHTEAAATTLPSLPG